MEEQEKKKGPIDLDWDKLLPSRDEEPPVLVVTTTGNKSPATSGDQSQQSQNDELKWLTNEQINDRIARYRQNVETLSPKLPDKGEKLRANLKRYEEERDNRKRPRMEKDDDGCQEVTQSENPRLISATNGFRQESPSSLPRSKSSFASCFSRKLEGNTDCRTVDAFETELSTLTHCGKRKMRLNGQFSPRGRHRSGLSSRQFPFQCPSNLSIDVDKKSLSNGDQGGGDSSASSPVTLEETLGSSFSEKRNASQILPSNDLRGRNGKTIVLLDEEEPKFIETTEQADKFDESMKETTIYYPSRDDPESVEICYSDMKCLAPETYLSSTVMNFYIRYLQERTSPTDRARCDYHFFNTYFYKKLKEAVLKKSDNEALFVKFRRWWKGVNIFQKAYILLPIHEQLHWSLVIICVPDKEDESGPIILHLDSLGLHYSKSIFDNIRRFLREEWNYLNQGEAPLDLPIAEKIWKNLPRRIDEKEIAVPQQKNEFDCGLFVLFFMERFIEDAPERLKKQDLAMFGKRWFEPKEASDLRAKIRKLLVEEFRNASKDKHRCDLDPKPLSSAIRIEHQID